MKWLRQTATKPNPNRAAVLFPTPFHHFDSSLLKAKLSALFSFFFWYLEK